MEQATGHANLMGFVEVDRIEVGWLSMEQARQFCECGDTLLRNAVKNGRLEAKVKRSTMAAPTYRKGWWFEREELARWISIGKPTAMLKPEPPPAPEPEPEADLPLLADAKPLIDSDIRLLYKMLKDLEAKVDGIATDVKVLRTELMG